MAAASQLPVLSGSKLSGSLDRTAKYTKKWQKRFVVFDTSNKKLSYAESSTAEPKATIIVSKIVRQAELQAMRADSTELFSFTIDGQSQDGKPETWSLRASSLPDLQLWYETVRSALAASGVMEPLNCGLPAIDPRSQLPFATVPLEHLHRFGLLEKAIVFYFKPATVYSIQGPSGMTPQTDQLFALGDKNLYVFKANADVARCVALPSLKTIIHSKWDALLVGLQLLPPEHDLLLKLSTPEDAELLVKTISQLLFAISQGKAEVEVLKSPESAPEQLAEAYHLRLTMPADYKLNLAAPTPKSRLRQALEMFEKQNGFSFGGGPPNSANPPSRATAAGKNVDAPSLGEGPREKSLSIAPAALQEDDELTALLTDMGFTQYVALLKKQHVDLDVLSCMEPIDLENFGIKDPKHREMIVEAANQRLKGGAVTRTEGSASPPSTKKISIDLSDDDEPLPPKQPMKTPMPLVLDSDDDLDLLPPKKPPEFSPSALDSSSASPTAKAPIVLDDDDI